MKNVKIGKVWKYEVPFILIGIVTYSFFFFFFESRPYHWHSKNSKLICSDVGSNTDGWFHNVNTVLLNMIAVTIETAMQECSKTQVCGAYDICRQRHKNCVCVFIWGSCKCESRESWNKRTFLCLCPWMWCLLKSLSEDSLHLRGKCNTNLHFAVEI